MRTQKLVIPRLLPSLNKYTDANRSNPHAGAKMKRKTEDGIVADVLEQKMHKVEGCVYVNFYWTERDKRRDLDNIAFAKKFVLDALVKAGILEDDGWSNVKGFSDSFAVDEQRPHVEVEIVEED